MKIRNLFLFLFILVHAMLYTSCFSSREKKEEKNNITISSNFETALKETNLKIEKAILDGDYEIIIKYYSKDAIIAPNFHSQLKGLDTLRASYKRDIKKGIKFSSFNAKADKIWEDHYNIYEYGSYGFSISSKETRHPYAFTGSYFTIWEKQKDSSLLIKYQISNLDFNPCKDFYGD